MLEEGLSDVTVNAIAQDTLGFLWIGTRDGLNRYDGYSFTHFRMTPGDSASLGSDEIWDLCVDREGVLWVGTSGGLSRYHPQTQSFTTYRSSASDNQSISSNDVFKIFEDSRGLLWLGTNTSGVNRFDKATRTFRRFHHDSADVRSIGENSIEAFFEDAQENVWIGLSHNGLDRFDRQSETFTHFRHRSEDSSTLAHDEVWSIARGSMGSMYVGTYGGGLDVFDPATGKFTHFRHSPLDPMSLSDNYVGKIFVDGRGDVWIGTQGGGGLAMFDPRTKTFHRYVSDGRDPFTLSDNYCAAIFEDRTGTMWFGTGNGLNKLQRNSTHFSVLRNVSNERKLLAGEDATCFLQTTGGKLWIGTRDGLTCIEHGKSKHYFFDDHATPHAPESAILSLCEDGDALWIGSEGGLHRLDQKTNARRTYRESDNPGALKHDNIRALCLDRSGVLWVGTNGGGLYRFDRTLERFTQFVHREGDSAGLVANGILRIIRGGDGKFLIGTRAGLTELEPTTGKFTVIPYDTGGILSFASGVVEDLCEAPDGKIWIATARGLYSYDRRLRASRRFDRTLNLPDIFIRSIQFDENGFLWVATRAGLTRCDVRAENFTCTTFGREDGLPISEFNPATRYRGAGGVLYFGGASGVVLFDPLALLQSSQAPRLILTDLKVLGEPRVAFAGEVHELPFNENTIEISLAVSDYSSPRRNRFTFILEGFDRAWSEQSDARSVRYTNLRPGKYTFRARGANAEGVWTPGVMLLSVVIAPPWYASWWFIAIVIVVVSVVVALPLRSRYRRAREIEMIRSRISRDLHDDIGSTLTRITVLSDVALEQSQSRPSGNSVPAGPAPAEKQDFSIGSLIQEIGTSARELHETISDVVWSLDSRHDSMSSVLARIRSFTTGVCEAKEIDLSFIVEDGVGEGKVNPEVIRTLLLITKEGVANAVRYAGCKALRVAFRRREDALLLEVDDDGIGLPEGRTEGHGLQNMKKRAELLGGIFNLSSRKGEGTHIQVELPVRSQY